MAKCNVRLFTIAILLFCCAVFQVSAAEQTVFGLCDVGDVIKASNGSIVFTKGNDCTKVILAPYGSRIKLILYEIKNFDAVTFIHDGGSRVGTLTKDYIKGEALGGSGPTTFYSSSNALLIHTDKITNTNNNKLNATFEMLPYSSDRCSCLPTVNAAKTVCSFPPHDNSGIFYHDKDELYKKCITSCNMGHEIIYKRQYSASSATTSCYYNIEAPKSSRVATSTDFTSFNPNLVSCSHVIPATQVLFFYQFTYVDIPCSKLNITKVQSGIYNFLVSNKSNSYVGECYKNVLGNCTASKPVLATCSTPSDSPNNSLVKVEIRDNIEMADNVTMTLKRFDVLYDSDNIRERVKYYVENDLIINNTTAINFQNAAYYSELATCSANHVLTGDDTAVTRKPEDFCISCPLHNYKYIYTISLDAWCQRCASNKHRPMNESQCVNGNQVYPSPSDANCFHTCGLGKFFNNVSGICDWCDYGYFQNSTTSVNPVCLPCPDGNTTMFVGAQTENDCMMQCEKGQFAKYPSCFDCVIGYYMPYKGNSFSKCFKCPPGNTTLNKGTANHTGCVDQCTIGEYFNITQGNCVICPNNTYQDQKVTGNVRSCKTCPRNAVTMSTGATSITACLGPCSSGEYLDTQSRNCRKCPKHTYNDEGNQTSFTCKPCPQNKVTQTEGSTNISQCNYDCSEGTFFNLTSEQCENCSVNTYQDKIGQDSCKPCKGNSFTLKTGSTECIAPCNHGEFLNKLAEACQHCQIGYFQNRTNHTLDMCLPCPLDYFADELGSNNCTACPDGGITVVTAAKDSSECIERCSRGYYLNKTLKSCQKCAKGFYQDQNGYRDEWCVKCPSSNLTTLQPGAKSAEECVGYCVTIPCLNGAKCTNIDNGFNCTCPEYLEGNQCQTIADDDKADVMEISAKFTNFVWNNNLLNRDSEDFKKLAYQIESAIRDVFKNDSTFRTIKVDKFTQGSVISDFQVNYVAGTEFTNPFETIRAAAADGKIGNNLTVNSSSLNIVNYTCGTPLGMENGRIPDSAITSANPDNKHPFTNARLNHNGPGWTPDKDAYLQVDFGEVVVLTGIGTQGSSYSGGNWLKSYHFNYSVDGNTWVEYKEDSSFHKVNFQLYLCITTVTGTCMQQGSVGYKQ